MPLTLRTCPRRMADTPKSFFLSPEIHGYLLDHATPVDEVQQWLIDETHSRVSDWSMMQIAPEQGAFMTTLTRIVGVHRAVEVGTFTGYSALCIARGLEDGGRLLCCDVSEEWTDIGREAWKRAGVDDRIDLEIAPAIETLRALPNDEPIDPRTPCLIGVAKHTWHPDEVGEQGAPEPLDMWEQVARTAGDDTSVGAGVLEGLEALDIVYCQTCQYDDAPARLSERLGVSPRRQHYSGIGGTTPQVLVQDAAARILLAVAKAIGGLRQGAIEFSPRQEAILDLADEPVRPADAPRGLRRGRPRHPDAGASRRHRVGVKRASGANRPYRHEVLSDKSC